MSAAHDILSGSGLSKGVVLLADILPSVLAKLMMTRLVGRVEYQGLIRACVLLTALSLLVVAFGTRVAVSLLGVVLASASSGMGESAFLSLATQYTAEQGVLVGWASGTGMAGLFGASAYALLTSVFGISPRATLLLALGFPLAMRHQSGKVSRQPYHGVHSGTQSDHSLLSSSSVPQAKTVQALHYLFTPLFLVYFAYPFQCAPLTLTRGRLESTRQTWEFYQQ